jgi:hypothetical protein
MVIPASYPLEHGRGNPDFQWEDHVKIFKMDIDGGLSIARSVLLRGSGLGSHGPTHHGCKPLAAISSRINDPRLLRGVSNGVNQKYPKNNCYYNYNGMKMFKHLNHRSTFIQACHYQLCPTFIPGAGNDTATLVGIVQGYSYLVEVQDSGLRTFLLRGPAQSEVPSGFGSSCHPNFPENKKKVHWVKSLIFTMNIRNQRRKLF